MLRRLRRICEHYGAQPDLLLRERDHRQPGRARHRAVRPAGRADRPRRLAALRTRARVLAAAAARRALRRARLGQRRDRRAARHASCARGIPRSRSPAAAAAPRSSRSTRGPRLERFEPGLGAPRRGVPSRLPRVRAARARARPRERPDARRRGNERARARHRRRRARRGRAQRIPGNARVDVATGRAGRAAPTGAPPRCSSPATTNSTSGTSRTPPSSPDARPSTPSSTRRTRSCLRAQVACAAHELPLSPDDAQWFGDGLDDAVRELVQADLLMPRGGQMYWSGPRCTGGRCRAAQRIVDRVQARRRRRRSARSAPSTTRACSRSRTPARCTCTRASSTASTASICASTSRSLSRCDDDEYTMPRTQTDIAIVADEQPGPGWRVRRCTSARSRSAAT